MNVNALINKIKNNKIVIYGAGYVAKQFYDVLEQNQLTNNLEGFVTTDGGEKIAGYTAKSITSFHIDSSILILIAVHESVKDEIISILLENQLKNYIWIYPQLHTLILGDPIEEGRSISLRDIWKTNRDFYWMAVRYLAIENYFGNNTYGYEIYKIAMSLHTKNETAVKRLEQFIQLIKSWERNGYDGSKLVSVFDDFNLIDGAHRMSLAFYFNQKDIKCKIYTSENKQKLTHDSKVLLPKYKVEELNWDGRMIKKLEQINARIDQRYV